MLRFLLILFLLLGPTLSVAGPQGTVRVIDADTWDVGGDRVRLHGIDAPELDQTCTRASGELWFCGRWASQQTKRQFGGAWARCDAVDHDRYGRIVARCFVDGADAGQHLVQSGWAYAYRRYSMAYDLDETRAAVAGPGLHGSTTQTPAEFRSARRAEATSPGTCAIKGNISSSGTRIYHMPGQEHYGRTRISLSKGERWFCSEAEARAAGWRRARK